MSGSDNLGGQHLLIEFRGRTLFCYNLNEFYADGFEYDIAHHTLTLRDDIIPYNFEDLSNYCVAVLPDEAF